MKANGLSLLLMMLVVLMTTTILPSVFADTIQGVIESVNGANNSLSISRIDPSSGTQEKLMVVVVQDTQLKGLGSLAELKVGSEVKVNADQGATGIWEAKKIETLR